MLRFLVILLVINLLAVLFILTGNRSAKEKTWWSTLLLTVPLFGILIYYLLKRQAGSGPATVKSWDKN